MKIVYRKKSVYYSITEKFGIEIPKDLKLYVFRLEKDKLQGYILNPYMLDEHLDEVEKLEKEAKENKEDIIAKVNDNTYIVLFFSVPDKKYVIFTDIFSSYLEENDSIDEAIDFTFDIVSDLISEIENCDYDDIPIYTKSTKEVLTILYNLINSYD